MMSQRRFELTLVELLVVIATIGVLVALLLPAVRQSREAARRMSCSSNIRQLGIAVLNYEYTHKKYPRMSVEFGLPSHTGIAADMPSAGRWSGFIGLLPFMESGTTFVEISSGTKLSTKKDSKFSFGPYGQRFDGSWAMPSDIDYPPNCSQLGFFRCPSAPGPVPRSHKRTPIVAIARTNYAFNLADSQVGQNLIVDDHIMTRGPFARGRQFKLADVIDGTSNTIMFGEIATTMRDQSTPLDSKLKSIKSQGIVYGDLTPSKEKPLQGIDVRECLKTVKAGEYFDTQGKQLFETRGMRWLDALACYTGFTTILGPNGASCSAAGAPEGDGIYSAGSYHFGGAHVVMFDNTVKFIPNEIDTQPNSLDPITDYYSPGVMYDDATKEWTKSPNWDDPSPFGVWGAMGTRGSGDNIGWNQKPPIDR